MVQYIGVIAFLLCIVHYVYQAILLPSMRQSARDKLFVLRDELRNRYIEVQDTSDKVTLRAFKEVDSGINRSLNRLHLLTFSNLLFAAIDAKKNHIEHKQSSDRFHALLTNSQDNKPKEIVLRTEKVLKSVLGANSFMFVIYLVPFILFFKIIGVVYSRVKNNLKNAGEYMVEVCMVEKTLNKSDLMLKSSGRKIAI